jgi:hypothetical protein
VRSAQRCALSAASRFDAAGSLRSEVRRASQTASVARPQCTARRCAPSHVRESLSMRVINFKFPGSLRVSPPNLNTGSLRARGELATQGRARRGPSASTPLWRRAVPIRQAVW